MSLFAERPPMVEATVFDKDNVREVVRLLRANGYERVLVDYPDVPIHPVFIRAEKDGRDQLFTSGSVFFRKYVDGTLSGDLQVMSGNQFGVAYTGVEAHTWGSFT